MPRLIVTILCLLILLALGPGCGGKKSYDPAMQAAVFNYGEVLDGQMMRAQRALQQVRDLDSAQTAAGEIRLINTDLADLVYNAPRLSEDGQIELGKLAAEHLARVERLKFEIERDPYLAEIFAQDLEEMMGYLQTMASGKYVDSPVP